MDMKMRHTVKASRGACGWLPSVAFAGLLCVGCGEDTLTPDKALPTGKQVVVDYTVGEAQTRSVSHDALPAHERIKSLVYLLYDNGGEMVKKRDIPGISDMKEGDWPMVRSTMTWAQREALKDTLVQGQSYTAVFIANADKSLFNGEEVLHLTETVDGEEAYVALDDVYLSLPTATAFGDNNMFYLCVKQIASDGYDRDNHCNCPVTLQRIVSRTDFFSDDYPAWDTDFTRGEIREFTDSKVYDVLVDTDNKMPLGIESWLDGFISKFSSYAALQAYYLDTEFTSWFNKFKSAVKNLDYSTYIKNMPDEDKLEVQELLYNSCLNNATLKSLWQPWTGLQAKVVYSSRADRFYVSGKTSKVGDGTATESLSPFLDMIQKETAATDGTTVVQNTFTIIGFGENADAATGSELNKMAAVRLYGSITATSPVMEIPITNDVQSFATQGGNERVQLEYCPIKTLTYNTAYTTGKTHDLTVDIKSSIKSAMSASGSDYDTYSDNLDAFFATEDCKDKYGESLEKFVLQITLPDLSNASALRVTSEWSVKE